MIFLEKELEIKQVHNRQRCLQDLLGGLPFFSPQIILFYMIIMVICVSAISITDDK